MKCFFDNINYYLPEELNKILKNIESNKQNDIKKIRKYSRKKQAIVGEYLLMQGLNNEFKIPYNNAVFYKNKNGKRYIKNYNIYFSISHSFDLCICVFSNNEIGVDIEKVRHTNLNTVSFFATQREKEYIFKSKDDVYYRLFEIYTLKEAYIKMKGTDFKDIKNIEFYIKDNNVTCSDYSVKASIYKNINGYVVAWCEKKDSCESKI